MQLSPLLPEPDTEAESIQACACQCILRPPSRTRSAAWRPTGSHVSVHLRRYDKCKPIDVTNILWAAARFSLPVGSAARPCLEAVSKQLSGNLLNWRPKEVGTVLWSLGRLGYHPGVDAVNTLLDRIIQHRARVPTQHLTNALYGVAQLRHMPSQEALLTTEMHAVSLLGQVRPRGCAVVAARQSLPEVDGETDGRLPN